MGVKDGLPREQIKEETQSFLNYNAQDAQGE